MFTGGQERTGLGKKPLKWTNGPSVCSSRGGLDVAESMSSLRQDWEFAMPSMCTLPCWRPSNNARMISMGSKFC